MNDNASMMTEITLIHLPAQLSEAVDQVVTRFVKEHEREEVRAYQKWHGADLWMIFADSVDSELMAIVTRRVTIGAYSDDPNRLAFISDIVVTKPDGRYILPRQREDILDKQASLSIFEKTQSIFLYGKENGDLRARIQQKLNAAWEATKSYSPHDAVVLLP